MPTKNVCVVSSHEASRSMRELGQPVLVVTDREAFTDLVEEWGITDGDDAVRYTMEAAPVGEPVRILDKYPPLRNFLSKDQARLELQLCSSIALIVSTPNGQVTQARSQAVRDGQVLVTEPEARGMLRQVAAALNLAELDEDGIREILQRMREQASNAFRLRLREAPDDLQRLVLAVGETALRSEIPGMAIRTLEEQNDRPLTPTEIAELAVAVHGYGILQRCATQLAQKGILAPTQWAGRTPAKTFVTDLGFAPEWAGYPSDSARDATLRIDGAAHPGPLHPYQVVVTERIKAMIRGEGPARGFVALPTGAGKTRVAVQAVIEAVLDESIEGPVVWIAQSDELCEQAVQTWAYLWRALGPDRPLVVSRFWAGNGAVEEGADFQVVVATPEKLTSAKDRHEYAWLQGSELVIVDEAHTSVAPEYTGVLEWLGRRSRTRADRRLLIGLSATPFRNTNEEETHRLARRYDLNRLDEEAFGPDPHRELQDMGVLARVKHRLITGADISMSEAELASLDRFKVLPAQVEQRLGDDLVRNQRIVDHVVGLPDDWTALLFATSVENAKALAALLTFRGVPARSVSAGTPPSQRRAYVERFRGGEIRVLTNYNVLAQGFDAPAVRAVYVTRPTYSRNLYQQMIGRGLRGPLNGGSEEVMVVNVADNVRQYGAKLAFYDFDHLWTDERVEVRP
ncbi:DEAD/DEAH box helicase [Georgenia sp. SUBG003]|uniref:DEAD/DEAH box helicase n=1 Tax=Georgenia sp. SUBG003 TaxID=1497974 RepID=UPI0004D5709F|nr:hypothetical protein DA06_10970 [Georgenia sp. SUBG003]